MPLYVSCSVNVGLWIRRIIHTCHLVYVRSTDPESLDSVETSGLSVIRWHFEGYKKAQGHCRIRRRQTAHFRIRTFRHGSCRMYVKFCTACAWGTMYAYIVPISFGIYGADVHIIKILDLFQKSIVCTCIHLQPK